MNPIIKHSNNGRSFLFVGGLPLGSHSLKLFNEDTRNAMFRYTVGDNYYYIDWPYAKSFLGTIHTEGNALVFSEGFDPAVLVESLIAMEYRLYRDYNHPPALRPSFDNARDSVASLLESKGYTMLNPYGEEEPELPINTCKCKNIGEAENCNINCDTPYADEVQQWRTSEENRYKFKIAVIEVNPNK